MKPPLQPPDGFLPRESLGLESWHRGTIAVDATGKAHCYLGYRAPGQDASLQLVSPQVGLRTPEGLASRHFVSLERGRLSWSQFLSASGYYRLVDDKCVRFPTGANSHFCVLDLGSREEDAELTRQVFGATAEEYQQIADAIGRATGLTEWRSPRVTFSRAGDNLCDMTGGLIPREFPYVAFAESQYHWGHVSLWGMCRFVAFVCPSRRASRVRGLLVEEGVSESLIDRVVDVGLQPTEIITYSDLWR